MGSVYSINTIESKIGKIQLVMIFMSIFRLADYFSSLVFCFFSQVGKAAVPLLVIFNQLRYKAFQSIYSICRLFEIFNLSFLTIE